MEWPGTTVETLARGRTAYLDHCTACHAAYTPDAQPAAVWRKIVAEMAPRSRLDHRTSEDVVRYLIASAPPLSGAAGPKRAEKPKTVTLSFAEGANAHVDNDGLTTVPTPTRFACQAQREPRRVPGVLRARRLAREARARSQVPADPFAGRARRGDPGADRLFPLALWTSSGRPSVQVKVYSRKAAPPEALTPLRAPASHATLH